MLSLNRSMMAPARQERGGFGGEVRRGCPSKELVLGQAPVVHGRPQRPLTIFLWAACRPDWTRGEPQERQQHKCPKRRSHGLLDGTARCVWGHCMVLVMQEGRRRAAWGWDEGQAPSQPLQASTRPVTLHNA